MKSKYENVVVDYLSYFLLASQISICFHHSISLILHEQMNALCLLPKLEDHIDNSKMILCAVAFSIFLYFFFNPFHVLHFMLAYTVILQGAA